MKKKIKISHTTYPDGVRLYPYDECKENKNAPFLILVILFIILAYVAMTGVLLLIHLTYN